MFGNICNCAHAERNISVRDENQAEAVLSQFYYDVSNGKATRVLLPFEAKFQANYYSFVVLVLVSRSIRVEMLGFSTYPSCYCVIPALF